MAKVLKSLRIEEETDEQIRQLQESAESLAATYNRVLIAGLTYLQAEDTTSGADDVTSDYIATLKEQLQAKDEQIKSLQQIAMQSQTLQLANSKPRGLFRRSKSANLE